MAELPEAVQKSIGKMSERPKTIYKLKCEQCLTIEEIAIKLGLSTSTVESHIDKAL